MFYAKLDKKTTHSLSLKIHALDTAGIALKLWEEVTPECICEQWKTFLSSKAAVQKLITFLALAHDTGKLTTDFQEMILGKKAECSMRHELSGELLLVKYGCPGSVAAIIGAHHGMTQEKEYNDREELLAEWNNYIIYGSSKEVPEHKQYIDNWMDFLLKQSGYQSMTDLPELSLELQSLLSGLVIAADWIASNESYFPLVNDTEYSHINQEERIEQAWRLYPHTKRWVVDTIDTSPESFQKEFGFLPNALQKTIMNIIMRQAQPGLIIIESSMGSGKTEAALKATEIINARFGAGGIFFGLPTQATANGLFDRGYQWGDHQASEHAQSIRLAHGDAMLQDQYTNITYQNNESDGTKIVRNQWAEGRKRALYADFVFGTVDQILKAGTAGKHCLLYHYALAGKAVIIDECHAYDAYMNVFLDNILYWLGKYHTPVIIMSATLPQKRKEAMLCAYTGIKQKNVLTVSDQYPLVTWTDGDCIQAKAVDLQTEERSVFIQKISHKDIEAKLQPILEAGGCAGIIMNTVREAQEVYESLQELHPILFHSRFTVHDRAQIENTLKEKCGKYSTQKERKGTLVIGTQVMEQSLDVDFDVLFTELCPMELLLQRIGREHRHPIHDAMRPPNGKKAICYVIVPDKIQGIVYQPFLLKQALRFLPDEIVLPTDIPKLVNRTFEEYDPDDADFLRYQQQESHERNSAKAYTADKSIMRTIHGMLNRPTNFSEYAVRKGRMPYQAIVLMKTDDTYHTVPWDDNTIIPKEEAPDYELTQKLMLQRISLPFHITEEIFEELQKETMQYFPHWSEVAMLKNMAALVLDEKYRVEIGNDTFTYTQQYGLQKMVQK